MPDSLRPMRTIKLAAWVMSLTDDEARDYLLYLCGWKPEIIAAFKTDKEASDDGV
jgi:hypothetical protein